MFSVIAYLRCLLSLSLLLFLVAPTPLARAGDVSRHAFLQHFEPARNNGTPIVLVRFGNGAIGRFLVDTGATDCIMTGAFAKQLGYKEDMNDRYFVVSLLSSSSALLGVSFFRVPQLNIGGLTITGATFLVVGPHRLPSLGGQPVDGILGGTLLSRFGLLLDYPRHTLVWMMPGNLDAKAVAALGFSSDNAVSLSQETNLFGAKINHYSAHVELKSKEQTRSSDMVIDTGSPYSSLSYDTAQRLTLQPLRTQPFTLLFTQTQPASIGRVPSLRLGQISIPDVSVLYPHSKDVFLPPLIGENILGGSFSFFDFGPHRFYFKPVLPWLLPGPLPPIDRNRVDWDRLRHAPDLPLVADVLDMGMTPEAFESRRGRIARLRSSLAGDATDAVRYAQIGLLLRADKDEPGARAALEESLALLKADAVAHSNDPLRAAQWAKVLLAAGQDTEAVSVLQNVVAKNPASAISWCSLGLAQETQAARRLVGPNLKAVTDILEAILDFPLADPLSETAPAKLEAARAEEIQAGRRTARDSFDRAVSLAPQDAESYRARAVFEALDGQLQSLLHAAKVSDKGPSPESELAGALADYQTSVRLDSDNPDGLRRAVAIDLALPRFHDRGWLKERLRGMGRSLANEPLMSAREAQARLDSLSRSSDKAVAVPALEALGMVQDIQDDAEAETTWQHALALDPARPNVLRGLAARLLAADRLDDLRLLLTAQISPVLAPSPRIAPVHILLSTTLLALGMPDDAEAQARLALQAAPDSPVVNLLLAGLLLNRSGKAPDVLAEAARCLATAQAGVDPLAEGKQPASVQTMQAVLLAVTTDPTLARDHLMEIVKNQPTCTQAREALAALTLPATAEP